jgi:two-component system, chemotaxis family, sensor kinase CheA
MSALIEQFIVEARELVTEASDDLLAYERAPDDRSRLERVFRAFHTLKGGAAIAGLPDMSLVLHAGEDLLDGLRRGEIVFAASLANALLGCIDQVGQWVDALARDGRLPDAAAERAAALADGLRRHLPRRPEAGPAPPDPAFEWAERMIAETPTMADAHRGGASLAVAIAYAAHPNCFFNGDDPIGLLAKVPQLVALTIAPRAPWPPLEEINPFECNLVFRALSLAPRAEVAQLFRLIPDQVRIAEIPLAPAGAEAAGGRHDGRHNLALRILAAQRRMLLAPCAAKELAGRLGAAARAVANALRFAGADAEVHLVESAHAEALAARVPDAMLRALDRVLATPVGPISADSSEGGVGSDAPPSLAIRTLRIEEAKVDRLIDLAGELIVAKNSLNDLASRAAAELGERDIARTIRLQAAAIDRLVGQAHHASVQLRMVPLAQMFRRFTRVVRDAAQELGKSVELVLSGEDTEADKAIVDAMFEPLLHVVRNALGHGIEMPPERRAAGKPEQAQITMRALHRGEQVVIEIGDDGRGIDPAAVRRKAREQSRISDEEARELGDEQIIQLVFSAGLSTSAQVSQMSGRGVGLAAVRGVVERFGGSAKVESRRGHGTTIRLALPLSMAFMRIMTVQAGGELFGVPIEAIAETVRLPRTHIVQIRDGEAFVLRDKIVPTCRLDRLLELPGADHGRGAGHADDMDALILVTDAGGQTAGIEIDGIGERLDVVVKPMQGLLAEASDYAGTTLLGNGRVLLVLNLGAVLP